MPWGGRPRPRRTPGPALLLWLRASPALFFIRIPRHVELAVQLCIGELHMDVVADAFNEAITPVFVRRFRRRSDGMRVDLVRRAERDIDSPAIRLPTRRFGLRAKVFIRVTDPPVMLGSERVLDRARRGVAARPELLNECLALAVGLKLIESIPLRIGDNVRN